MFGRSSRAAIARLTKSATRKASLRGRSPGTRGASTPEELVQAVVSRLAAAGYDELAEVEVAREDVHFRLPREVVAS